MSKIFYLIAKGGAIKETRTFKFIVYCYTVKVLQEILYRGPLNKSHKEILCRGTTLSVDLHIVRCLTGLLNHPINKNFT